VDSLPAGGMMKRLPAAGIYSQKMPVLNVGIALKLYGKHATPRSAAACQRVTAHHVHA